MLLIFIHIPDGSSQMRREIRNINFLDRRLCTYAIIDIGAGREGQNGPGTARDEMIFAHVTTVII